MKKLLSIGLSVAALTAVAQQRMQLSNFHSNAILFNPAHTGVSSTGEVKLGFRKQLAGFSDGPVTYFASGSARLGGGSSEDDTRYHTLAYRTRTSGMFANRKMNVVDKAMKSYHGLGATVIHDVAGPFGYTTGNLTYAYHQHLAGSHYLAIGAGIGAVQNRLDQSKLNIDDPKLGAGGISDLKFDATVGVTLHSKYGFVGYGMQNLLGGTMNKLNGVENFSTNLVRQHNVLAGLSISLVPEILTLLPSAKTSFASNESVYEGNVRLAYRNFVYLGAGYRLNSAAIAMVGFQINNRIAVNYAYDYTTSDLKEASQSSHEIVVGLRLNTPNENVTPLNW